MLKVGMCCKTCNKVNGTYLVDRCTFLIRLHVSCFMVLVLFLNYDLFLRWIYIKLYVFIRHGCKPSKIQLHHTNDLTHKSYRTAAMKYCIETPYR